MFRCIECGTIQQIQHNGGTGYAINSHDFTVCYECCGKRDAAEMESTGGAVLYLVQRDGAWFVTNWPCTLNIRAYVSIGRLYCFLHFPGARMVRGHANGYGYDKRRLIRCDRMAANISTTNFATPALK